MVVQVAFLILHKISPLENELTEITLRKFVYLALHKDLSSPYTVITRQILFKLEYGWPFFCVCTVNLYRKTNFISIPISKYILIPVQSNHPDIFNII